MTHRWHMRVKITKPVPARFEGFDLAGYAEVDQTYDINTPLCDLLMAAGYAVPADEELFDLPTPRKESVFRALGSASVSRQSAAEGRVGGRNDERVRWQSPSPKERK